MEILVQFYLEKETFRHYNYRKKFRVTINTCWRSHSQNALIRGNCANSLEIYMVENSFRSTVLATIRLPPLFAVCRVLNTFQLAQKLAHSPPCTA